MEIGNRFSRKTTLELNSGKHGHCDLHEAMHAIDPRISSRYSH